MAVTLYPQSFRRMAILAPMRPTPTNPILFDICLTWVNSSNPATSITRSTHPYRCVMEVGRAISFPSCCQERKLLWSVKHRVILCWTSKLRMGISKNYQYGRCQDNEWWNCRSTRGRGVAWPEVGLSRRLCCQLLGLRSYDGGLCGPTAWCRPWTSDRCKSSSTGQLDCQKHEAELANPALSQLLRNP